MIHYHGTPVGGKRINVHRFLMGRHALVSFAHPEDIEVVAEVCQSYVLDNGAFSVWRKGGSLDVTAYTEWCRKWGRHPSCDWCLIPDVIDGTEEENDQLVEEWPRAIRGCPVWHLHESIDRLARLCEAWPTVSFGSSGQYATPGTASWRDRMSEAMDAVCDSSGVPPCRFHGLRMLNPAVFSSYPFTSADSTNATQNGSREVRKINTDSCVGASIIADRIEQHNSPPTWKRDRQSLLWVQEEVLA